MSKFHQPFKCLHGEQLSVPSNKVLTHIWERNLSENPDRALSSAVTFGEERITYSLLNQLSNRLARAILRILHTTESTEPQQPVIALDIQPSIDLLALQLACWKVGAAELTLDGDIPLGRVKTIFELTSPVIMITDSLPGSLCEKQCLTNSTPKQVRLSELKMSLCSSSNLSQDEVFIVPTQTLTAVLLFTSGSTGQPKGVRLTHSNLLNRLQWQWEAIPYNTTAQEVCLSKTSVLFVDSLTETLGPLLQLIPLVIAPRGLAKEVDGLHSLLQSAQISRLILVPSLLTVLLMKWKVAAPPESLKHVVCSGEALPTQVLKTFRRILGSTVTLFNFYGSTELTGDVTTVQLAGDEAAGIDDLVWQSSVAIGKPISNTNVYLVSPAFEVLTDDGPGQIAISGRNLAEFISVTGTDYESRYQHVFDPKTNKTERCYLTGDTGVIKKGNLFFLGREDSQIKLRGFRINLKEIEGTLNRIDAVSKSVVLFHSDLQQIVAAVKLVPGHTLEKVSTAAKNTLPAYMHPLVVAVHEFPLLPATGKLDSRAILEHAENFFKRAGWSKRGSEWADCAQVLKDVIETIQSVLETDMLPKADMSLSELGVDSIRTLMVQQNLLALGYTVSVTELIDAKSIYHVSEVLTKHGENKEEAKADAQDKPRSKYTVVDLTSFQDKNYLVERLTEWFFPRSPLDKWLEGVTVNDFRNNFRSIVNIAVRQIPCFSFVILDDKTNLVAIDLLMTDDGFENHQFPACTVYQPLVHFLELCEKGAREEILSKGLTKLLDDFTFCSNPNLPAKEQFHLLDLAQSEVERRASQAGVQAIVAVNTNPVTQWHALKSGYEEKTKLFIKNMEFNGRRYFTGDDVPSDYFAAGYVKYL